MFPSKYMLITVSTDSLKASGAVCIVLPHHKPTTLADFSNSILAGIFGIPAVYPIVINLPSNAKLQQPKLAIVMPI